MAIKKIDYCKHCVYRKNITEEKLKFFNFTQSLKCKAWLIEHLQNYELEGEVDP